MSKKILSVMLLVNLTSYGALANAVDLFLFFPSDIQNSAVQQAVMKLCPTLSVSVFERAGAFWRAYRQKPPSAVVTTGLVYKYLHDYEPVALGKLFDKTQGSYYLVSITQRSPSDIAELVNMRVGVLNELGRQQMNTFLNASEIPSVKLKKVTKPRDLLPLLNFNSVDFLLVDERTLRYLKHVSKQKLQTLNIGLEAPLAIGAVRKTAPPTVQIAVQSCLDELDTSTYNQQYFFIDAWQKL